MRILYRQGLISARSGFLTNSQTAGYIDLTLDGNTVIAAIADGTNDYLISEESDVLQAWGPLGNAPIYYLFWDLDLFTGAITRRYTSQALSIGSTAPASPVFDTPWWDTTTNKMFAWDGDSWNQVYRVYAATIFNGNGIAAEPLTSQVGLNVPADAGYVLTDGFGNTFRNSRGNVFTTETISYQKETPNLVKFGNTAINVQANETIPAMSFVYLVNGRAALASSTENFSVTKAPIAFVTEDTYQNRQCQLHLAGHQIFSQTWNFPISTWGKPIYCGSTGELTFEEPTAHSFVKCGFVLTAQSIYLTFETRSVSEVSLGGDLPPGMLTSADTPLQLQTDGTGVSISIDKATNIKDGYISAADFSRIGTIESQLPFFATLGTNWPVNQVTGLVSILSGKAATTHTHVIADVDNLQNALGNKADVNHSHAISNISGLAGQLNAINVTLGTKMDLVLGASAGNVAVFDGVGQVIDSGSSLSNFATINTIWPIANVSNLQNIINTLAPLNTIWPTSSVNGLDTALASINIKADKVSGATFGNFASLDVTGNLLDSGFSHFSFAPVNATWAISNVIGLQSALDGKANSSHPHIIADTVGLQSALDNKITIGTSFSISQTVGLQTALDNKVSKSGDTMTGPLVTTQLTVGGISLLPTGAISLQGNQGNNAQVLTSAGANTPAVWSTINLNGPSAPTGQALFGTGSGIAGTSNFTIEDNFGNSVFRMTGDFHNSAISYLTDAQVNNNLSVLGALVLEGPLSLNGVDGNGGQVIISNGVGMAPTWGNIPQQAIAIPASELVFGIGTDVTSSSNLTYNNSLTTLSVGSTTISSSTVAATNLSASTLSVSGLTTAQNIQCDGITTSQSITIGGALIVNQTADFNDSVFCDQGVYVGLLQVAHSATVTENLTVDGNTFVKALTFDGPLSIAGDEGVLGKLLSSNGPGMTPSWIDAPSGTVPAITLGKFVVGSGTGIQELSTMSVSSNYSIDTVHINGKLVVDLTIYSSDTITGNGLISENGITITSGTFEVSGSVGNSGDKLISTGTAAQWVDSRPYYYEVNSADIATAFAAAPATFIVTMPFACITNDTGNNKGSTQVFIDGMLMREHLQYTIFDNYGISEIHIDPQYFTATSYITIYSFI